MKGIELIGFGYQKAKHQISNDDLAQVVDTSHEWIVSRTGIETRYVSSDENTSDLGVKAAKKAIADATIDARDIRYIVCATITPDHQTPSTACLIQEKLGLNEFEVMSFDLNAACSGFIYALRVVSHMLQENEYALIIGSEVFSKIIDWKDRNTCILFGDGAGAAILKHTSTNKEMFHYAKSMGDNKQILHANGVSLIEPLQMKDRAIGYVNMNGAEVFRFAVKVMEEAIVKLLKESNKQLDEIDLIIPHQANIRIIQHVAKRMKLDISKFFINVNEFGNTSAASIPIAIAQAKEQGILKAGMKIILVGFGAGFTYGATYIEL